VRPRRGVLLDTHVLLWCLEGSPEVSSRLIDVVNSDTPLHFSSLSIAEATLKASRGKLVSPPDLSGRLRELGFQELSLTAAHATEISRFPQLEKQDPFDRLLLAQAVVESIWFETANETLLALGLDAVRDARA